MRERPTKTEKEPTSSELKIHSFEVEKEDVIYRGRMSPTVSKQSGKRTSSQQPPGSTRWKSLLKLNFRKSEKFKFVVTILFSLLYAAVVAVPLAFIWLGAPRFREGVEVQGKLFISAGLILMLGAFLFVLWSTYKRWVKRHG